LDQIISSAGATRQGCPKMVAVLAFVNHASSTTATPLPDEKMKSTKYSPLKAL